MKISSNKSIGTSIIAVLEKSGITLSLNIMSSVSKFSPVRFLAKSTISFSDFPFSPNVALVRMNWIF